MLSKPVVNKQEKMLMVGDDDDGESGKSHGAKFKETEVGNIPVDWNYSKLKNVCIQPGGVQTGPFGSLLHKKDYKPFGTPIITVEHLGENRIIHRDLPCVSDEDCKRLSRYTMKMGDIIFSRVGSVDRRSIAREDEEGWLFSGRCLRVRPNPELIDPYYLSWFFGLPIFKEHIRQIAVGATMPSLNTKLLSNVEIFYPNLIEQRSISSILNSLDDKIELNRQMNTNLEAIGQSIFKHWFVDFEFPNEEGKPYKSSGGEMEGTELGEVPVGWRVGELNEISTLMMGLSPQSASYNDIGEGFPLLNGAADFSGKIISPKKYTSKPTRICQKDDLLFCIRATIGNITFSNNQYCLGRGVASLTPKDSIYKEFIYFQLNYSLNYLISRATGSVISGLSKPDIENLKIIIPVLNQIDKFHNNMINIFDKIQKNSEENITLPNIRDALLPKLMSGEIRTIDN